MKSKIILFVLFFFVNLAVNAQKRQNKSFYSAGAVAPFSTKYMDYLSYNSKFVFSPVLKDYYEKEKLPFDPNGFTAYAVVIAGGLKNKPDGEFKVTYDVEDFKMLGYTEVDDSKAMIVGLKANVKVFDANNELIYSRYLEPTTKSYVYNKSQKTHVNINNILQFNYDKLIKEFNYMYTYGPQIFTNVIGLGKIENIVELAEFDSSIEVFEAMKDIKRSEQSATLDGVIEYWKPFLKYNKIKDKDRAADLRLAASYNTAVALILQNKLSEAEKLLPIVKANDRTMLGMTFREMELKNVISSVKKYQTLSKEFKIIEPISVELPKTEYSFDNVVFKNATIIYDKDEEVKGTVKFMFNNPTYEYLPGWDVENKDLELSGNSFTAATQIAGGLLKMRRDMKTEDSKATIEIEGKKKPKKIELSDIVSIKAENGDYYTIETMGFGDSKRYAAVKEVSTCTKITLYQEIFPGNAMLFKRNGKDEALQLKVFESDKKTFKKFFADCPRMHAKIDSGEYSSGSSKDYMKFMDEYKTICCPPAKKK